MLKVHGLLRYASTSSASSHHDIVVVGGGLVGNAIAASIGSSKLLKTKRVLVLHAEKTQSTLPAQKDRPYSNRVSAVSPASVALFKDLSVWDRMRGCRVKKVSKLHVLESCSSAEITFDQPNSEEVAFIVENDVIIHALSQLLSTLPSVSHRVAARVTSVSLPDDYRTPVKIDLEGGDSVTADLVIGADGGSSLVRSTSGVDTTQWVYDQSAIVATLSVAAHGDNATAWQRFTPNGPIALLPLTDTLSSLVWTTTPQQASRLLALPPDSFVDELNNHLMDESQQVSEVNQLLFSISSLLRRPLRAVSSPPHVLSLQTDNRASFPLGFSHAHSYVGPRFVLIGDAAHRMHPLAGQGVNLGWRDVGILTRTLEKVVQAGADIGSELYLRDYDTSCQRFNVPTMIAIDWLNRLYRTSSTPIVIIRSLGLSTVNSLLPLKDLLVHTLSHPPNKS